jgi:Peptidase family M1 domain
MARIFAAMKRSGLLTLSFCGSMAVQGQCNGWQQRVHCTMQVELDVRDHRYTGTQQLVYSNHSPDTLRDIFFHLYPNAFRPGSEMDVRSRTIADPDARVGERIKDLKPNEQGELVCEEMAQDGLPVSLEPLGTILRARLPKAIPPGDSTELRFRFHGQVPVQIRRSGRNNTEGVAYSMAQWFPKVAEYDARGWHANPYVAREFHGVWGDYDVHITLDAAYTVAATGVLMNPSEVGHGYAQPQDNIASGGKLTWHFSAPRVHDFAWVADTDFVHTTAQVPNGPLLRFFHKRSEELAANWGALPAYMVRSFQYMSEHFGEYPYTEYAFAQGGDGGMEYPMLTLITGKRKLGSLVGVSVHESVHSWYYGLLASNEGRYPWMDEGFTEYASSEVMAELFPQPGDPHSGAYDGYFLVANGVHEPLSMHADHYRTNREYGLAAYARGEMFLAQLAPVIGQWKLQQGLLAYYKACAFKHPEPIDVERVMEKVSGLELDWYFDEWMNTTRLLDYGVSAIRRAKDSLCVELDRVGEQLMPVEVRLVYSDSTSAIHHIPLSLMLGAKGAQSDIHPTRAERPWQWTNPTYTLTLPAEKGKVLAYAELDPSRRLADVDRSNDRLVLTTGERSVKRVPAP